MSEKLFYKVARLSVKTATFPFPVDENVTKIIKALINEEQARFILSTFKKTWITEEEIKVKTEMDENFIKNMLNDLMHIGIIIGLPHPRSGVQHYKMVAFFPGVLEFTLMRGEKGEKQKELAMLWEKVFSVMREGTQKNYEKNISIFKGYNIATDRVVPVEKEVKTGQDIVLRLEDIEKIINKEELIGLAVCYCRHRKDLIGEPCKTTDLRENCIVLGNTAEFCIQHDFAKQISKEQAMKLLRKAEDEGLVHKIFHTKLDPERELDGICSCCACCCGTFTNYHNGAFPAMSYSSYLAKVDQDLCIGCGTCVEICPMKAIDLQEALAVVIDEKCLGCGLCAHHCPEEAMKLERVGERLVFVPPPRISN